LQNDFDVAYATYEGLEADVDISGTYREWAPAWSGSNRSYFNNYSYQIGSDNRTDIKLPRIPNETWNQCNGTYQDMWVTFTRTKDSSMAAQNETTPRSLISIDP
jgi:hypothetical protein